MYFHGLRYSACFRSHEAQRRFHATVTARIPRELRTKRLFLRPWDPADAAELEPILRANVSHFGAWIPTRVSTPLPATDLAGRLKDFADAFADSIEFRYAIRELESGQLCGEASLFVRSDLGRVALGAGRCAEIGYWLDAAVTGQGFATEAAAALIAVSESLREIERIDIRCDAGNIPSAAVPQRLGFSLAETEGALHIWRRDVRGG
jgi:RimJ/RimL family protein N-acetyltransferase